MTDTKTDIHQLPPNDANQRKLQRWKQKWRGRYVRGLVSQYESYLDQSADTALDAAGDGGRGVLDKMAVLEFQIESAIQQEMMSRVGIGIGSLALIIALFGFMRASGQKSAVAALQERIKKSEGDLQSAMSSGREAAAKFDEIKKGMEATDAKIAQLEGQVAPLGQAVSSLDAKIQELTKKREEQANKKRRRK